MKASLVSHWTVKGTKEIKGAGLDLVLRGFLCGHRVMIFKVDEDTVTACPGPLIHVIVTLTVSTSKPLLASWTKWLLRDEHFFLGHRR